MAKAGVIRFVSRNRKAHGVHEQTTEKRRMVLCTVKSIRQSEYYQAENAGYTPEYQFNLTLSADYHGEGSLIFESKEYAVIRTFEPPGGGLEIIAGRKDRNEPDDDGE